MSQARTHVSALVALLGFADPAAVLALVDAARAMPIFETLRPPGEPADGFVHAGPVGAGISLEYYFSSVDNERYGCGSKITHNLTGLFGVAQAEA